MATPLNYMGIHGTSVRRSAFRVCSSHREEPKGFNPDEALMRSLGEISRRQGRVPNRTNLVFGGSTSEERWREIDKKVNSYPSQRTFTAIGSGGNDFVEAMVSVVEDHLGPVHVECVSQRESSNGKYLSVRVGPVWVQNADQVVEVYADMREDKRVKWCM